MNEMGLKEKALVAVLGVIILYALAVALWFLNAESAWKKSAKAYAKETTRFEKEEKLISEKKKWDDLYESEKAAMPTFAVGKATDTTWRSRVEELAKANLVQILQIEHSAEIETGDVLQLPIEIKNFESSLEALVKFLHALDSSSDGMFDVRELNVRPSNKKGYLKGSMSLRCAYMREKES